MSLCAIEKVCTEILFGILCQLTDLFVFCLPLIYFYLFFDLIVLLDFSVLALSEAKVLLAVYEMNCLQQVFSYRVYEQEVLVWDLG